MTGEKRITFSKLKNKAVNLNGNICGSGIDSFLETYKAEV
jgi:hypothetical protein